MENDDEKLILLCQKGKIRAFETLVNRYKKNAYFIALGLVGNSDDAFDLSQEAFVRVYKSIDKYYYRYKRRYNYCKTNSHIFSRSYHLFSTPSITKNSITKKFSHY